MSASGESEETARVQEASAAEVAAAGAEGEPVADDVDAEEENEVDDEEDYSSEAESEGEVPDEAKTPVTIVTGFLGAGKTTLVNYILREQTDMKIAVIENEFGAVSIDNDLVSENIRDKEDVVVMDNGCVCCTVRGDLVKTFQDFLTKRKTFDCILLETTGLADPSPIASTFNQDEDIRDNYRIDSILCLVDAKNITAQLERQPQDEGAVNEAAQQLAFADCVMVNKTDLVEPKELEDTLARIKSVNAFARILQTQRSRVPLDQILALKSFNLERTLELLDAEEKEEKWRAEEAKKKKEEEEQKGDGHSHDHTHHHDGKCGEDCKHDHAHTEGHKCGEGCSHDHGHSNGHGHGDDAGGENGAGKRKNGGGEAEGAKRMRVVSSRHDSRVGSLGLTLEGNFDVDLFNKFMAEYLEGNAQNLFRSKGVLAFEGQTQKFVFQGVHEQIKCQPSDTPWPEDGTGRHSKIVFIGLSLDKALIREGLQKCLT